jgi:WD40 repeat protein
VLVTGSERGRIQLWEWKTGKQLRAFNTANQLRSLCLHPDGKSLATITESSITRWDVYSGSEIDSNPALDDNRKARCVAHSPDGKLLLVTGEIRSSVQLGAVYSLWDLEGRDTRSGGGMSQYDPKPIWTKRSFGHRIAWHPNSEKACSPSVDTLLVSGKGSSTRYSYSCALVGLAYSPDGSRLFLAGAEGVLSVLDSVRSVEVLRIDKLGPIEHFALSPDGKRFVVANERKVMLRVLPKESPR